MQKHEDIFNLVTATIVMHDMMVKERISSYEVESEDFMDWQTCRVT